MLVHRKQNNDNGEISNLKHKLAEEIFGDTTIQIWKQLNENLCVVMYRGLPAKKTFCIEHFLQYADKVQKIADRIRERKGEI